MAQFSFRSSRRLFRRWKSHFSQFWAKLDHRTLAWFSPQIKHETGHVHLRVLRENTTGQNSLQLSGGTGTHAISSIQKMIMPELGREMTRFGMPS
jgi:hypothetical protein